MHLAKHQLLRLISFLIVAGSLLGIVWIPKPSQASNGAGATPSPIPFTDLNPLGANFFLEREVEPWKREQTVKMAKEAGIGWIKQMFVWEEIEPKKGYFFDDKFKKSTWEKYDDIVSLAERYGMRIIARLDRPPAWTRKDNSYATAPPDKLEDYANFVKTVVTRYKGRVQYYQVWNEPNIWPEWGDKPVDPAGYVAMLKLAATAAREADPNVVILAAPLAETLEESPRNLSELKYLEAMYKAGAKGYFDVLSVNAYGFEYPPDAPPDPNILNFSRVQLLRDVMLQQGDSDKAIWFNEFGWNASPPDFPANKLVWRRVSEEQQATYTADAIRLARSWGWVGVINIWYFRQVGDIPIDQSDYFFRVVDTDFVPRLVYFKLKDLGQELRVAGQGAYEESNPAVEPQGSWHGRRLDVASGQRLLQSPDKDCSVTFTINGTALHLTVLAGRDSTRLHVTVDGKDPGLSRQEPGVGSIIDLPPSDSSALVKTTVITGLSSGKHTIKLEYVSGAAWAFDTFEVENRPATTPFWGLVLATLIGLAGLIASLVLRRKRDLPSPGFTA